MTYHTEYIGQFANFDKEKVTGRVSGVGHDSYIVNINWQLADLFHDEFKRGVKPENRSVYPIPNVRVLTEKQLLEVVSKTPKYLVEGVALSVNSSKIHPPIQRKKVAKPSYVSQTPVRKGTGTNQEFIMAKTAVFDSEGTLVEVYTSGKEAKAHNKGDDLVFVTEKNFPEGGIGEFATVDDLFPPKEVPEVEEGEKAKRAPRVVRSLIGEYTVVKADGVRFAEGDARADLHEALVSSTTFEEYLEKAPESISFVTSRGATQTIDASNWARYALRRGWVTQGTVEVEEAGDNE